MSTGAGGTNLGGGANFNVMPGGMVELAGGSQVSVTTEAGMDAVREALDSTEITKLEGLMEAQGYKLDKGIFVPHDNYAQKAQAMDMGPDTGGALAADDAALSAAVFGDPSPYNPNTTEKNALTVKSSQSGQQAVAATSEYFANPTAANEQACIQQLNGCADDHSQMNIYELLFICFRESINQTNQDKAYFLKKIQDYNNMAEGLSEYLETLVDKSQELSTNSAGKKAEDAGKESVEVDVKRFDLSSPGSDGKIVNLSTETKRLERTGLSDEIKQVESMQETVRNKRQMASTSFQNFDQKANQLYNLMSSVLKSVNEMRSGTVRNML